MREMTPHLHGLVFGVERRQPISRLVVRPTKVIADCRPILWSCSHAHEERRVICRVRSAYVRWFREQVELDERHLVINR